MCPPPLEDFGGHGSHFRMKFGANVRLRSEGRTSLHRPFADANHTAWIFRQDWTERWTRVGMVSNSGTCMSEPLRNVLSRRQYFERLQTDIEGAGVVSKNSSFATIVPGIHSLEPRCAPQLALARPCVVQWEFVRVAVPLMRRLQTSEVRRCEVLDRLRVGG